MMLMSSEYSFGEDLGMKFMSYPVSLGLKDPSLLQRKLAYLFEPADGYKALLSRFHGDFVSLLPILNAF